MCSIVGVMTSGPPDQARLAVRRMVAQSHHRGPNGSGEVGISLGRDAGHLALGHTRLSIIDLSERSSQPMQDPLTGCWLVYNGEIYNFRELRLALEYEGIKFTSSGDTEVLLKALVHWGEDALNRLQGMFAFAFWNACSRELLLARDPFGIKPLYYFRTPGLFLFASEVKVLQASQAHGFETDPAGVESFLTFGAVLGPSTILKKVKELAPGWLLKISGPRTEPSPRAYTAWPTQAVPHDTKPDFQRAVEQVTDCLRTAVDSHLVSDVPVGIPLSGGIDSSLLACLAAERHDDLSLLTIGFSEEEFSETRFAAEIARHLGLRHEVVNLTPPDFNGLLSCALNVMDQPTVDGINIFVVSKVAASLGIPVLLSGLGGDELFGGYTTFRNVPLLWRYRFVLHHMARLAGNFGSNPIQWAKLRQAMTLRDLREAYLLQRCIRWNNGHRGAPAIGLRQTFPENGYKKEVAGMENDDFRQIACLELSIYMRNQLLRDADVFSMANSVEVRVPFLDINVARAALALPKYCHFDMRGGKRITRCILEQASGMRIRRKKMGFTFPWTEWLQGPFNGMLAGTLHDQSLYDGLGLDFHYGRNIVARLAERKTPISWMEVWSLFVLLEWEKRNRCAVAAA